MKFLVINDDGIEADGLHTLTRIVSTMGSPVIVAPDRPQSGVGHQVTADAPVHLKETGDRRFSLSGTPADCARIGLLHLAPEADWVVAGINHGGNLGADVYISGTVAAAREAALLGYRAIAVSHYVARGRPVDWDLAARRATPVIRMLLERHIPPRHFWNVNMPHTPDDTGDPETVFCALDPNPLSVQYRQEGDRFFYCGDYHQRPRDRGRDVDVCLRGHIAVTLIPLDLSAGHVVSSRPYPRKEK